MGLIKYGLAVGIGYHFGQPHGRQQLLRVRQQIIEFAHKPAITQLRERGWDIAGERALAAKKLASRKLSGKSKVADTDAPMPVDDTDPAVADGPSVGTPDQAAAATESAADGAAATGFGGRTVAEDSHAAITGMSAPPPAGRVPPTDPTTGRP
jgi:hypothetical protein